jgi:hypothetical protein
VGLGLVFYVLAVFSKATASVLPLSFLFLGATIWPVKLWKKMIITLVPYFVIASMYILYFSVYFLAGKEKGTGYVTSFSPETFFSSQMQLISAISGSQWISSLFLGVFLGGIVWGLLLRQRHLVFLPIAYLVATLPTAFFQKHISPYYIYIPALFLLLWFCRNFISQKHIFMKLAIVMFLFLVFLSGFDFRKVIVKYRHPEWVGFDERNMNNLKLQIADAVDKGRSEFYFSSWEMSPNLYSLVYHGAMGIFMAKKEYLDYEFEYDRPRERMIIPEIRETIR